MLALNTILATQSLGGTSASCAAAYSSAEPAIKSRDYYNERPLELDSILYVHDVDIQDSNKYHHGACIPFLSPLQIKLVQWL